jgi:hypothetical protein
VVNKGKLQESIVTLYLRLNGYFTTSLILHHPEVGKNTTDLDVLAVRFPRHSQPDRGGGSDPELKSPDAVIDLIICEVKSAGQALQFNSPLRDSHVVRKVLQWMGAFEQAEIDTLTPNVLSAVDKPGKEPTCVPGTRNAHVRTILFSLERDRRNQSQPWFLHGPPVFDYLWKCLHPSTPRPECSTQYDFGLWGTDLEPLVRYVKRSPKPDTFKSFLEGFQGLPAAENV